MIEHLAEEHDLSYEQQHLTIFMISKGNGDLSGGIATGSNKVESLSNVQP